MPAVSLGGRTAATAATANHTLAELWNPHATKRLSVFEIGMFKAAAGTAADSLRVRRTSARGTAGSTLTPGIENNLERGAAPQSGALLDVAAFTVQPTLETGILAAFVAAAVAGSGIILPTPRGIEIPPGTGLALVHLEATAWPASDVWFGWTE